MTVEYSYQTDVGRVRSHNEDAVKIFENDRLLVAVVADGMGGHAAGDVASQLVMEKFTESFHETLDFGTKEEASNWLLSLLEGINQDILTYAKEHNLKQMGTTLVAVVMTEAFITMANIGDSRGYVMAYNELRQLTTDHTFVGKLLEEGQISPRAAKVHPQKHTLINALGVNEKLDCDLLTIEHSDLNAILLCTDGLTGMVEEKDILPVLKESKTVKEKVSELIERANANGGRDNVTVALIERTGGKTS